MASQTTGDRPRSLVPIVGSFLVGGAFLLIVGFWAGSRRGESGEARVDAPRQIVLLEPDSAATFDGEVPLVFETSQALHFMRDGWMAGRAHLHAYIDGVELMPDRDDLEEIGERRYRWVITGLAPGPHEIRLVWSGPDHRPLAAGGSRPVLIEVR